MKNALNNQVGMIGDMFLWLVANLKQVGIYFIKPALPPNISAGSVWMSGGVSNQRMWSFVSWRPESILQNPKDARYSMKYSGFYWPQKSY